MKLAGRIAKWIVVAFVAIFNIMFIFRCCVAGDRSVLSDLTPTDALRTAYADGEVELITHEVVREISENGYMSAYAYVYSPEAEEVQITIRYNDSVYEYNALPEDVEFSFTLTDSVSGTVYEPSVISEDSFWMYNHRRLVFSGVKMSEESNLVVKMMYNGEEISFETIHYADQNVVNEPYKLSRREKEALGDN